MSLSGTTEKTEDGGGKELDLTAGVRRGDERRATRCSIQRIVVMAMQHGGQSNGP
jgi:hypothetical protein